jgi:hypothetical protein
MISPSVPWNLRSTCVQIGSTDTSGPNLQDSYRWADIETHLRGPTHPVKTLDI